MGTTKHSKDSKVATEIVLKEESYRLMGACFEVYKEKKTVLDEQRAQVINYLKATGKPLGILVNFGHYPKIEHERFVNHPLSDLSRVS